MQRNTVLVVDDDKSILAALRITLEGDFSVCTAENGADAIRLLREREPVLVLLDIGLPDVSGIELIGQIRTLEPETAIIMITAVEETRMVVKALKLGAYDYLVKPIDAQELKITLQNALETKQLKEKIRRIQKPNIEKYRIDLIGQSPQIKEMIKTARKLGSNVETPILITGETGTGKGVLARSLHFSFSELPGPFVSVNCTAITHDLFESELFGYDRGAFTGARSDGRIGCFEEASGGTLFLDEIGSMPLSIQSKFLGVLDDRSFRRVGGNKTLRVSARIIAATNSDLEKAVQTGEFRRDLFFRLNVVSIHVPPLRERLDDIIPLTEHFLGLFNQKYGKSFNRVSPEARKALLEHTWPGNIRELRNMLERIVLLQSGNTILPNHLGFSQPRPEAPAPAADESHEQALDYEEAISKLLLEALRKTGGNVLKAARLLNMPPHKIRYRIKKYNLSID